MEHRLGGNIECLVAHHFESSGCTDSSVELGTLEGMQLNVDQGPQGPFLDRCVGAGQP